MIGVSNSAPRLPVLVSVNVPPARSSGLTWPARVRSARSAILRARPPMFRSPALLDHRDHQAALGVHRDAQVLGVVVGDRAAGGVDDGVELGVGLERLDGGQREERQERQLDALAGLERGLGPVAQPGDGGDVGLDHGGQLGRGLQRLDHALGDDLPGPGHPLGGAAQARLGDRGPGPAQARVRLGGLGGRGLAGRGLAGAARRARAGRGGAARGQAGAAVRPDRAASSTSCLRIRPPTPVPVTRGQVDAVLGGQLADQRGDVRALAPVGVIARGRRLLGLGGLGRRRRGAGRRAGGAAARPGTGARPGPAPPGRRSAW